MFRLRLFGGLALEEEFGVHAGKAAQRRRLALLALLETAPRRTMTRDKLLALLWEDEDAENARHRLSVVLHELRKTLGDDAIRSVGDDVTLNHELVGSDVADFNAALTAGDFERAVTVYDGPFLDGVFLSGAPEFEHWVDGERARWARNYRTALERLAEGLEAKPDWQRAADAWQKLTAADPYNSRIASRYMNALSCLGETAAALQFARGHEMLIKEELGTDPNQEFRAAVARLERGPAPQVEKRAPRKEAAVEAGAAPAVAVPPARRHLRLRKGQRKVAVSSVVVMLLFFLIIGFFIQRFGDRSEATADPGDSIVVGVLPFDNLSDNRSNEHLSDGLTEEMISALGKVPGLNVPSRTTVFAYQTRTIDAKTAARELDADYLMDGSVRRAGEQLRIAVQIVDSAGMKVWSDAYDRRMGDIFEVQREIAAAAVEALRSRLNQQLAMPAMEYTTRDPEAYDLYLRGRGAWYSRSPDRLQSALAYFQRAVARDSTYALAYTGIADVYNMFGAYNYGLARPAEAYPRARAAAARALRLEPQQAEAHAALGLYLYNYEWKWGEAERELRRALTLNPGYTMARHWLELVLLIRGKNQEALEVIRGAREQDPRSPLISSALAHHYYYRREFNEAIREYHHALELDSTFTVARLGLAMSYTAVGQHDKAVEQGNAGLKVTGADVPVSRAVLAFTLANAGKRQEAQNMLDQLELEAKDRYIAPHFLALVHLALGDEPRALDALEAAYNERSGSMLYLLLEPPLEALYDQPRFRTLTQRVHKRQPRP